MYFIFFSPSNQPFIVCTPSVSNQFSIIPSRKMSQKPLQSNSKWSNAKHSANTVFQWCFNLNISEKILIAHLQTAHRPFKAHSNYSRRHSQDTYSFTTLINYWYILTLIGKQFDSADAQFKLYIHIETNLWLLFCFSSACVPDAEKDTHAEVVDTVPHKGDHTGNKTQEFSSLPIKEYLDYHNQNTISANTTLNTDGIKRYKAHEGFGDRRQMVNGARTYFYQNEAQCEKNMETFLRCIEAVAGNKASTLKSFHFIYILVAWK